ncbi:L,D-transpeptidase family protein [Streptomyces sp. NPDC050504]|uniref:L,D-transpeptidase family protein n=1 Tax=Streptomyces sp. NPDC050504 TaxID=3365618 RepID=UPI0037A985AF
MITRTKPRRGPLLTLALSLLLALPLGSTDSAADPVPLPAPASAPAPALRPMPAPEALVPGLALEPSAHEAPVDTLDQVLAPLVHTPPPGEDAVEPAAPPPGSDGTFVEYVPASEVVRGGAAPCTRRTGPHQRQVERWLKLEADGVQSPADCAAVRAFQREQGIRPDIGFAGPVTWARMRWISAHRTPNAAGKCPVRAHKVACVDLPRQLMWVQQGEKVVYGPVSVRSGRAGFRTRTGWHRVYWKHKNHWSSLYRTPMPYSQFFSGGQAFHAIRGDISSPPGSRGCVNLTHRDAKRLWGVLKKGDRVYVWGRRPGT